MSEIHENEIYQSADNQHLSFGENEPLEAPIPPEHPAANAADQIGARKRFDRDTCTAVGPLYIPVTAERQQSIDYTSEITNNYTTNEGNIFASQLSARAPSDEVEINSFVMWTEDIAIGPEVADTDFASTCNWIFGYIKGTSSNKTMVLVIGQLFPDNTKPSPSTGYYVFVTPSTYFIPAGLNRDSAKFLLTNFEAQESNDMTKTHSNKRQRNQPPLTLRASITNQGESSIHLQDLNGNFHHTREKKDISKREKELGPIWRLTKGREKEIMGKDCMLQVSDYKQHIMDESINQAKDSTSEFSDSSLVRQIIDHPIVKDEKSLKLFLRANFGSDPTSSVSFSSFLPRITTPATIPTYSARCNFSQAAASFEVAARVFYSKEFLKVMDPVILILSGPLDALSLVADDLLLWTIERTFSKWGKTVRTESKSSIFPEIALETPTGCALLLTTMLTTDLTLLCGESLFLQERFYKTTIATTSINTTTAAKHATVTDTDKVAQPSPHCRFHLAHLLNAKLANGGKITPCKRGKQCSSTHSALNAISKSTALLLASKFNPTLRESVEKRIEEMSDKFKK